MNIIRTAILKANYFLNNFKEVIWLVGDGRSGTTWVSDLIAYTKSYRVMIEPFHPVHVPEMNFMAPHQYLRPQDSNEKVRILASRIFHGQFNNERVDQGNRSLLYDGILIKDIFANLLCKWCVSHFPKVRPVLLIRNPFSVAISKYNMRNWFWAREPLDHLKQPHLFDDYLSPFEDLIKSVSKRNNFILNQILIWSIINYVPLRQFKPGSIHICFYENIYEDPIHEISEILQFAKGKKEINQITLPKKVIRRPSRSSGVASRSAKNESPGSSWEKKIPPKIIDDGYKILHHFGLDQLYDNCSLPNTNILKNIHGSEV